MKVITGVFTFFFLLLVLYFVYLNHQFSHRPLISSTSTSVQTVLVLPHSHTYTLGRRLEKQGFIRNPYNFVLFARIHALSAHLHYGKYYIQPGMTALALLQNMNAGKGLVMFDFRIHEGWTMHDLQQALEHKFTSTANLEGCLYPDTYRFAWGIESSQIIFAAKKKMDDVLSGLWALRAADLPLKTPYEALIVASLIQTETSDPNERAQVAAVIYNRLRQSMRLQIDPTVMYGLGLPYGSVLTKANLQQHTLYNTYQIEGLPPTPIAFPDLTSLQAALHPSKITALYYVANGSGGHIFSSTYEQHTQAVKRYRRLEAEQHREQMESIAKVLTEFFRELVQ